MPLRPRRALIRRYVHSRRRDRRAASPRQVPHNGAVGDLACRLCFRRRKSYFDTVTVAIVGALVALDRGVINSGNDGRFITGPSQSKTSPPHSLKRSDSLLLVSRQLRVRPLLFLACISIMLFISPYISKCQRLENRSTACRCTKPYNSQGVNGYFREVTLGRRTVPKSWWLYLLLGIVFVIGGFIVLGDVTLASVISAIVIAWALLIVGVIQVVHAFRRRDGKDFSSTSWSAPSTLRPATYFWPIPWRRQSSSRLFSALFGLFRECCGLCLPPCYGEYGVTSPPLRHYRVRPCRRHHHIRMATMGLSGPGPSSWR